MLGSWVLLRLEALSSPKKQLPPVTSALKCKARFGAWDVTALSTEKTRLTRLSTCLRLEKLDACFLTEARLHDDIVRDTR